MEIASTSNINQAYLSNFIKLFGSAVNNTVPQIDAKLIAFCTILTVALSILVSFKQYRTFLTNSTYYPLFEVKRCLRSFRRRNSDKNKINIANNNKNKIKSNYFKYLKLKRLNIDFASIAYKLKSGSFKFNSNYLFSKFLTMNRNSLYKNNSNSGLYGSGALPPTIAPSSSSSSASIESNQGYSFRYNINKNLGNEEHNSENNNNNNSNDLYEKTNFLKTSMSMPVFSQSKNLRRSLKNNQSTGNLNSSTSNINRSRSGQKIYNKRVHLYKKLPLRSMSRAWGGINSIDLPVFCRKPCFYLYSWLFKCNLEEIEADDLNEFKNLSEFFRRGLRPNVRVIDQLNCLISPCDGKILHFGKVDKGYLEQVKGVNYSLHAFLGQQTWPKNTNEEERFTKLPEDLSPEEHALYEKHILHNPENCLYHCVIYLAPGDYHRFHSPTDWTIYYRRHFPGELFSVNPSVARWLKGLFNFNERVVYYGKWKYGFFSMTPVGATNVGSIKVYMDKDLTTNTKSKQPENYKIEKDFSSFDAETKSFTGIPIKRGDSFGEFNLGSTIVLIFEAPPNFEFNIEPNDKVLYGRQLGSSVSSSFL